MSGDLLVAQCGLPNAPVILDVKSGAPPTWTFEPLHEAYDCVVDAGTSCQGAPYKFDVLLYPFMFQMSSGPQVFMAGSYSYYGALGSLATPKLDLNSSYGATTGKLRVTAPAHRDEAPPCDYYLFIATGTNGTLPSGGRIVHVGLQTIGPD